MGQELPEQLGEAAAGRLQPLERRARRRWNRPASASAAAKAMTSKARVRYFILTSLGMKGERENTGRWTRTTISTTRTSSLLAGAATFALFILKPVVGQRGVLLVSSVTRSWYRAAASSSFFWHSGSAEKAVKSSASTRVVGLIVHWVTR